MELRNAFDVIKKPVISSKSVMLFERFGKLTFEVVKVANKLMVQKAIEKIWNVKVDNVRIINIRGKKKVFAQRSFITSDKKKAIVTLQKGHKIDIPGLTEIVRETSTAVEDK